MEIKCKNCGMQNQSTSRYCAGCGFEINEPAINKVNTDEVRMELKSIRDRRRKRNLAGLVAGILFFFTISIGLYTLFSEGYFQQAFIAYTCKEADKMCPTMITADMRMESVEALPGRVLQYKYTMVNVLKEEVDLNVIITEATPVMIEEIKQNQEVALLKKMGATFSYTYNDRLGIYICTINITPEMYN